MDKIKQAVFVVFEKNNKLLVVKSVRSAKQNLYTLVGGMVEENETILEAAVRECVEEINPELSIKQKDLSELFSFTEHAASDVNLLIEMNVLLYNKELDIEIKPDLEILDYKWIDINEKNLNLSTSITNYVIPWMKERK